MAVKTVDVTVVYKPGQKPNVELRSEDLPIKDNLLVFSNDKHDGFWVRFILDDKTLAGYRFVNSGMSPMYSALATGDEIPCPTSGVWDMFKPHDVQERTLIVRNKNVLPAGKTEERFGFTLRVTKDSDDNGRVLSLDPGGINTNGPTTNYNALLLGVGLAAVGLAVAYASGAFR